MQGEAGSTATRVSSFSGRLSRGATTIADRRQGYIATPHTHDCDMLFMPISGRFEVLDAWDHRLHSSPGSFIWFAAGALHATAAQTLRQTHLAIYMDADLWGTALDAQNLCKPLQGLRSGSIALNAMSQKVLELTSLGSASDLTAYCGALIMEAARLCANPIITKTVLSSRTTAALLAEHIDADLSQPLPVEVFARRHAMSRRQLERLFRTETGCSPLEYQQSKRLARAQYLLAHTDDSVLSVAQQVGWESASYLTRMMKRAVGKSGQPNCGRIFASRLGAAAVSPARWM